MLINEIKGNNREAFCILMNKMQPLINKYTYLLYKNEKEDTESELYLALWEAVNSISLLENDGQIVNYFSTAIKHRFFELYRSSRKLFDNEVAIENDKYLDDLSFRQHEYDDFVLIEDINHFLSQFNGIKKEIFHLILIENYSDAEVARILNLSRQYIHRMRKQLQNMLLQYLKL